VQGGFERMTAEQIAASLGVTKREMLHCRIVAELHERGLTDEYLEAAREATRKATDSVERSIARKMLKRQAGR
jgi:hypothetical protein